ncbi:CG6567 [Drosophila busckii]|uniref:palmitoyl-protein hydrolase n=1 Tax=Drosophila busckii TaxID=30019 RepID=A0A0M5J128_DROBS|nr:lysophospholipase-like protein 1 [Drosophila busckii]ALC38156.1 CG6567 [Drosophila busckii]
MRITALLRKHTASVLFLHGAGDTGPGVAEWVHSLIGSDIAGKSHIKVRYPTAPYQSYAPFDGELSNVWFNRPSRDYDAAEIASSMSEAYAIVDGLVQRETDAGIPLNRIIIGGFSNGGVLALHAGYAMNLTVAGIFAHSAFLNRQSAVYEQLQAAASGDLPELLMQQGDADEMVPHAWAEQTYDDLQALGVSGTFSTLNNTAHELTEESMQELQMWIRDRLP